MTIHFNGIPEELTVQPTIGISDDKYSSKSVYRTFGKRIFDISAVLLLAPLAIPLIVVLALGVMLDGGGPFFRQKRVGMGNSVFRMWKLRTMVPDAEALLEKHLAADPEARAEWNANQKLRDDPRITRFGRLLRRTSLDELPQLFNVLTGDMSLVGPRPMLCEQRPLYPGRAYYELRPGITGPWQVSDRNAVEFKSRAAFDHRYFHDMSFFGDLRLMARTLIAVMRCTGH